MPLFKIFNQKTGKEISNLSKETLKTFTEARDRTIFVQAFIYIVLIHLKRILQYIQGC